MKNVVFLCVHNSCRSQIAEALGKHLASDTLNSYSCGTIVKPQINQDAVYMMKKMYGIDMEALGQYSKLIDEVPRPDYIISMGCNVSCPSGNYKIDEDWGLDDPSGKSEEEMKAVILQIHKKILELKQRWQQEDDGKHKG